MADRNNYPNILEPVQKTCYFSYFLLNLDEKSVVKGRCSGGFTVLGALSVKRSGGPPVGVERGEGGILLH